MVDFKKALARKNAAKEKFIEKMEPLTDTLCAYDWEKIFNVLWDAYSISPANLDLGILAENYNKSIDEAKVENP